MNLNHFHNGFKRWTQSKKSENIIIYQYIQLHIFKSSFSFLLDINV